MDIELLTTRKKLTKSLIMQFRFPELNILKHGEVLGFVINVVKDSYRTVLIRYENDIYREHMSWVYGSGDSVYRNFGKWSQKKSFKDKEYKDEWWDAYLKVLEKANNQIYV